MERLVLCGPLACLLAMVVPIPTANAADWVVDVAGTGDFVELSLALSDPAVSDGDRLWVMPGSYAGFETGKAVELLAATPMGFQVAGARFVGNGSLVVRGMRTFALELDGLRGFALFAECEVGLPLGVPLAEPLYRGWTRVDDCEQVLFVHSILRGSGDCYPDYYAGGVQPALLVRRSTVALNQCELWGGNDAIQSWECNPHYGGEVGVHAGEFSTVYLVASPVRGGGSPWAGTAAALHVQESSVEVRGQGVHLLWSGHPDTPPVTGSGRVSASGVRAGPLPLPTWVDYSPEARPYLVCASTADLGGAFDVQLHGPAGAAYVLAVGVGPAPGALPAIALCPVWLDLAGPTLFAAGTTAGHGVPVNASFYIPALPVLSGRALVSQAYFFKPIDSLTPPAAAQIF